MKHSPSCTCHDCSPKPEGHSDDCGCPDCAPRPVVHASDCGCQDCSSKPAGHADDCDCPDCGDKQVVHADDCGCPDCATRAAPSFTFTQEAGEDETALTLAGRFDASAAAQAGDDLIAAMGESTVVSLNMGALTYIASAGLRILLVMQKRAAASGKRLLLKELQPMVREVLEMSGMDRLFEIV